MPAPTFGVLDARSDVGVSDARSDVGSTDVRLDGGGLDAPADAPACTGRVASDDMPARSCAHGVQWIAWQIVPATSLRARTVSLFTPSGSVALLAPWEGPYVNYVWAYRIDGDCLP